MGDYVVLLLRVLSGDIVVLLFMGRDPQEQIGYGLTNLHMNGAECDLILVPTLLDSLWCSSPSFHGLC